jgi:hypothetical protein
MAQSITPFDREFYDDLRLLFFEATNLAEHIGLMPDQYTLVEEIAQLTDDLFVIANPARLYVDFEEPREAASQLSRDDSRSRLLSYVTVVMAISFRLFPMNNDSLQRRRQASEIMRRLYRLVITRLVDWRQSHSTRPAVSGQTDVNDVD